MMLLQTTTRVAVLAVALLTCPAAVDAAIKKDEVISLPGWSGKLPSRQWSGYLDVGPEKNRHLHCEENTSPSFRGGGGGGGGVSGVCWGRCVLLIDSCAGVACGHDPLITRWATVTQRYSLASLALTLSLSLSLTLALPGPRGHE